MHFTTNFHGTIIFPIQTDISIEKSVFLGLYLNYLRKSGVFERMAVGGNGGSFAVGYWNNILIPNVNQEFMKKLCLIYHNDIPMNPAIFDMNLIERLGIYEINNFLIRCKNLLKLFCSDIKTNNLKTKQEYENNN